MNRSWPTPILEQTADALQWLQARQVAELTVDSRAVRGLGARGPVAFIAWPGAARDGRAYVAQALQDGAVACLVEADGVEAHAEAWQTAGLMDRVVAVRGLKARSAEIAHGFYGEPSARLQVLAVTGTNGKTSTSWWTAQALSALGVPTEKLNTKATSRNRFTFVISGSWSTGVPSTSFGNTVEKLEPI